MGSCDHRWRDGNVRLAMQDTVAKRAALGLAIYGVRVQCERPLGKVEAVIEIRDGAGVSQGTLRLDDLDAGWLLKAITEAVDATYGPLRRGDVSRLLQERGGN